MLRALVADLQAASGTKDFVVPVCFHPLSFPARERKTVVIRLRQEKRKLVLWCALILWCDYRIEKPSVVLKSLPVNSVLVCAVFSSIEYRVCYVGCWNLYLSSCWVLNKTKFASVLHWLSSVRAGSTQLAFNVDKTTPFSYLEVWIDQMCERYRVVYFQFRGVGVH